MADVNKPKLQLRSGLSINGDKSPSPATKLLINHGKPNFTIQRSHKAQNGNANSNTSPPPATASNFQNNNNNNNEFVVKSTTFNGVFKPSNISAAFKQTLPQSGNTLSRKDNNDNEAAKVVLRRPRAAQAEMREQEDDENVPEFIRRQRRIQERLANQNILDFENRRSGYFTQVMISPSSPNRQSFVETMASPAVKPGLEMPPPAEQHEDLKIEETLKEQEAKQPQQQEHHEQAEIENGNETVSSEAAALNGQVEEEEVAKAIEEVNKAVAGEDDDKTELEDHSEDNAQETQECEYVAPAEREFTAAEVEETQPQKEEKVQAEISTEEPEVARATENTQELNSLENGHDEASKAAASDFTNKVEEPTPNGRSETEHQQNGTSKAEELGAGVTISHVNGTNGPSIPTPDPSGEKGVNYETKTVVSFSQELGNGDNKYPDVVKVLKDNEVTAADSELKELTKLKFEIKADDQDIEVKPVLVKEAA